jgi:hypothetical protein
MRQNSINSTNVNEIWRNDSHKNFSMVKNGLFCVKWLQMLKYGTKYTDERDEIRCCNIELQKISVTDTIASFGRGRQKYSFWRWVP